MSAVCSLCLSKDRNLLLVNENHRYLLFAALNPEAKSYMQYLEETSQLRQCWECERKLSRFGKFIKRAEQGLNILKSLPFQDYSNIPASLSTLFISQCEIIEMTYKEEGTIEIDQLAEKDMNDIKTEIDFVQPPLEELKVEYEQPIPDVLNIQTDFIDHDNYDIGTSDVDVSQTDVDVNNTDADVNNTDGNVKSDDGDDDDFVPKKKRKRRKTKSNSTSDLIKTIELNESHTSYKCKACDYQSDSKKCMETHVKSQHFKYERKMCMRCKEVFGSSQDLKEHRQNCATYKCRICDKTFKSNTLYYVHIKSHDGDTGFYEYCDVCDKYFTDANWYKLHFSKTLKHIDREHFKNECKECGMKFITGYRLGCHMRSIHLKNNKHKCTQCPNSYSSAATLRRHLAIKHNVGEVTIKRDCVCHHCGKSFTSNHLLSNHIRCHTGEKPFACNMCPARFSQHGSFYTHYKMVHKKKISKTGTDDSDSYRCEVCNKTFLSDFKRRAHYDFHHLKNTKFVCETCDKMFPSSTSLRRHNEVRHGAMTSKKAKVYCCETCGKTFNSSSSKYQHKKTHLPESERALKCRSCEATFRNSGALYTHYKCKHLKLKKSDRVRIRNLNKPDKEVLVETNVGEWGDVNNLG